MKSLQGIVFKNIIVRMPNWIGDMVMATPILSDLRRAYPKARITAMCRAPICDLLKEDLEVDEIFCFSKTSSFSRRSDRKNLIEKLQYGQYDLGILLTHSLSSSIWFWRGKVKTRLGYNCNGRNLFLTHPVSLPVDLDKQHLVTTYKKLLHPLGIPSSATSPRLFLTHKEVSGARTLLDQHGVYKENIIIGINPGATYGSAKCWLPERFREVSRLLLHNPATRIVFFGDQLTAPLVKEICHGLGPQVVNLAGLTSLREVAGLIGLCDVLLTNDSGPMHIADALGTKVVALFGSTNEVVTGPYNAGKVIHKHAACSPCYQRSCPIDFRCMKQIEAAEVYLAITTILNQQNPKLPIMASTRC